MQKILSVSLLLCVLAMSVSVAELTDADLDKIRLIVNEANTPIKTDVSWLRGKMDTLDKQITWLIVGIGIVVGIPQILIAWRSRKDRETERKIEHLTQEIETLKKQRVFSP